MMSFLSLSLYSGAGGKSRPSMRKGTRSTTSWAAPSCPGSVLATPASVRISSSPCCRDLFAAIAAMANPLPVGTVFGSHTSTARKCLAKAYCIASTGVMCSAASASARLTWNAKLGTCNICCICSSPSSSERMCRGNTFSGFAF